MKPFLSSLPGLGLVLLYLSSTSAQQLSSLVTSPDATDTLAIQQVVNFFAVAVDQHRFDLLSSVFTNDVTVNFNNPDTPILHGLDAVKDLMSRMLEGVVSLHVQSTHFINWSNRARPHVTTYNTATFFKSGTPQPNTYYSYGRLVE